MAKNIAELGAEELRLAGTFEYFAFGALNNFHLLGLAENFSNNQPAIR